MSRVEHKQASRFDENAIRVAFLSGERPKKIADRYDFEFYTRIISLIADNRRRWVAEEPINRELSDETRTVLRRLKDERGSFRVIHVPVARISMHITEVMESANARLC